MLTFANPFFLWGLLGLAAPILIHLINRDLFRPLLFPSIRFIRRGKLPVERKRRLRDLLLLALRLLLFAAIVSALARPQWEPPAAAAAAPEDEGDLVILLDASASMSGWNVWQEAMAKADDLLAEHGSAPVGLVISGAGPIAVEPLTTDAGRIRSLLNRAEPQSVSGDHRESFRQALRLLENAGNRSLAVISDFQQADWSPASLPAVPEDVRIEWIQVGEGNRENAGVLHARALPLADGRRQVVAEIKNFGQKEWERTLSLRAGGETLSRTVRLDPGETRSLSFLLEETSASRAEVSLDGDGYPSDNSYSLWLGRPPPLRVLAVAPTTEEPEKSEELFFVSRALAARTETQWLHFAVSAVEPGDLSDDDLQNIQAVFLLGAVPYLNSSEWGLLEDYLQQGGRLLVTPGKAPARQSTLLADKGLLDLPYDGVAGMNRRQPQPHNIDWVRPESSLGLLFRDEAARSLSHVSIYQYIRFKVPSSDDSVLLRASGDDPLLIQRAVGGGVVLATAFPFQTSWTDLPVSTAFLPMIRELVAGDIPPDHGIVNMDTRPDGAAIAARLNIPADEPALAGIDPLVPGIHVVANTPVVLNIPRSESLPSLTNPVDLQTAVAPRGGTAAAAPGAGDGERHISLWPWLALAALLFFILEMPLAARLRRLRPAAPHSEPAIPAVPSPRSS